MNEVRTVWWFSHDLCHNLLEIHAFCEFLCKARPHAQYCIFLKPTLRHVFIHNDSVSCVLTLIPNVDMASKRKDQKDQFRPSETAFDRGEYFEIRDMIKHYEATGV